MSRAEFEIKGQRSSSARAKGRVRLTRDDVIAAGAHVLDTEGVEGLSMRKVAAALETGAATLYWHVRDKDELLRLILDDTVRGVAAPAEGTWDERLAALLDAARAALRPRPVVIPVLWSAGWDVGPETLRVADEFIGLIARSGVPDAEVTSAYYTALTFLLGFVLAETSAAAAPRFQEAAPEDAERYPDLLRYGPGVGPEAMDRRFADGVGMVIAGIRARATERPGLR